MMLDGQQEKQQQQQQQQYAIAFDRAVKTGTLSETSRANYVARITAMERETGLTGDSMLRNPAATCKAIQARTKGVPQTKRAYLTAFMAAFRHDEDLKTGPHANARKGFRDCFDDVDRVVQERYDSNQPNKRQRDAYLPWNEVLQKRDALPHDSQDYLIMSLYTMIPPLRADFGCVRVLRTEPDTPEAAKDGNYIVVRAGKYARLVLNEFKTKSKNMMQYNKVLPKDLQAVIENSLGLGGQDKKTTPKTTRTHLIVSTRTGQPLRDNTYVVYVHRVLNKCLGKKVSISMLRHIFVNSLDFNRLTAKQKEEISADMLHSVSTNDRYRLLFNDDDDDDDQV